MKIESKEIIELSLTDIEFQTYTELHPKETDEDKFNQFVKENGYPSSWDYIVKIMVNEYHTIYGKPNGRLNIFTTYNPSQGCYVFQLYYVKD